MKNEKEIREKLKKLLHYRAVAKYQERDNMYICYTKQIALLKWVLDDEN